MSLMEELKSLLKTDERLVSDNKILKNIIVELALKLDIGLIELLLSSERIREHFFIDVNGVLIFDREKFMAFVDNKGFLPDSYTVFSQNIGLTSNNRRIKDSGEVVLSWAYKDCILEGGQEKEDQKRTEIFYNKILAKDEIDQLLSPKVFTGFRRINSRGEHKVTVIESTDNLIIRGNNLLALHSIKKKYRGRVKLIYIDPPYYFSSKKKADTFAYNSNFKLSTWLTFMKNRLEVARDLLSDDGAIFIQINDDGVAELHQLLKEVFNKKGDNNFINKITVKTKSPSGFASVNPGVFETAEYILSFAKNKKKWTYNEQYVESTYDKNYKWFIPNKEENHEKWEIIDLFEYVSREKGYDDKKQAIKELSSIRFYQIVADFSLENANNIYRSTAISNDAASKTVETRDKSKENSGKIYHIERESHYDIYVQNGSELAFYSKKIRNVDGRLTPSIQLSNMWTDVPYEGISKEGGVTLRGGKKPEKLMKRIIEMASNPKDIVLDFFVGSGTTCAVAHKMGRQYIGVEQLDYGVNDSVVRMKNVINGDKTGVSTIVNWEGGGDFVYCELMEQNEKYIKQIIKNHDKQELLKTWDEIKQNGFVSYRVDETLFDENIEDYTKLTIEEQKDALVACLDVNKLYLNYSEIEDSQYAVTDEEITLNKRFYGEL